MSYHLKDTVPVTYFIDQEIYFYYYRELLKPASAPVVMFLSNCKSNNMRNTYIEELMKYIPIDSYGKCYRNKEIPAHLQGLSWETIKWEIMSQYKFVIAFENTDTEDYVTEKLFHAFYAKTIPIYMGAPNVDEFLPSQKSIINVRDFP